VEFKKHKKKNFEKKASQFIPAVWPAKADIQMLYMSEELFYLYIDNANLPWLISISVVTTFAF